MTITALAADEPAKPTFREQLTAVLPAHTFIEYSGFHIRATWSTPAGMWQILRRMTVPGFKVTIRGPKTQMELANPDVAQVDQALRFLGGVSSVLVTDESGEPVGELNEMTGDFLYTDATGAVADGVNLGAERRLATGGQPDADHLFRVGE